MARRKRRGLTAIVGCMFSGKTSFLIQFLSQRYNFGKQTVQAFYPKADTRLKEGYITARDPNGGWVYFPATEVVNASQILEFLDPATELVAIDEAQFFDSVLVDVCRFLMQDREVVVAGLDTDFRREPFGPVPGILAIATDVQKLTALCAVCGEDANCTQRMIDGEPAHYSDPIVVVGDSELYEARCLLHYQVRRD